MRGCCRCFNYGSGRIQANLLGKHFRVFVVAQVVGELDLWRRSSVTAQPDLIRCVVPAERIGCCLQRFEHQRSFGEDELAQLIEAGRRNGDQLVKLIILDGFKRYRFHFQLQAHRIRLDALMPAVAVFARVRDNAVESVRQVNINQIITRTKNEEVSPVVERIYVDRVRVGPGTCGPASASDANGAGIGDDADSPGRLVRDDVERDTRALTEAVEQDLATGRACQAFVRENGMAP